MADFQLDQRYISISEPELGLGIVVETGKGRVSIHFPNAKESRIYATQTAPLQRITFQVGDTVADKEGHSMTIERVFDNAGVLIYFGATGVLPESELGNFRLQRGIRQRLQQGDVDTPQQFALRRLSLEADHQRRISPVLGFLGGRIDLIPHQLYIAHAVSSRFAPRVLLSDEVGLGKTIEACLILHRLLLTGRISRVLILVPESLKHQWFVELLRRFNLWFHIFDEERCKAAEAGAPDGNPFLDDQLILCSTSFLAQSPLRAQQAIAATWDMMVVDEAHHLEWSTDSVSPAYAVVESLSHKTEGLLLLTATPEQLGLESHFARLRLLDPDRYSDFPTFRDETTHHRNTADLAEKLFSGEILEPDAMAQLQSILRGREIDVEALGDPQRRDEIIQELLDQHGPGRVIFRNRRAVLGMFPKRVLQAVEVQVNQRIEWLRGLLRSLSPAKVLLISSQKEAVLALEKALKEDSSLHIGLFHGDMTLVQRDRNAAWFSEEDGAQILLCDEIGSEGRNFQFAHHLVLWDLPMNPELLEQRIGRLDRIGQTADICIHVPYARGTAQATLFQWYHVGLDAFEQNLEGGNQLMTVFGTRLSEWMQDADPDAQETALATLLADTQTYHLALKARLAAGQDRLLEMNSFRPEVGAELISNIEATEASRSLEDFMLRVWEAFDLDTEDLAARTYQVYAQQGNAQAFPALPDEGAAITFDRARALRRDDILFLTWDHPMATGALDMVLGSDFGTASLAAMHGNRGEDVLLEAMFVIETLGTQGKTADRFLPRTPIRIVVNALGNDITDAYPAQELDARLRPCPAESLLDDEMLVETMLPKMLAAATEIAEKVAETKVAMSLYRMNSAMEREIARLHSLQAINNHIRPAEIAHAVAEKKTLQDYILAAQVRLDQVQVILGR